MRRPTLYKHRGTWYACFWNVDEGKYRSKSLGILAEGKKERRRKAKKVARQLSVEMEKPVTIIQQPAITKTLLLEYVENFWQPDSEYVREKVLVERKPISAHYLLTNRRMVETKMKSFPGLANIALCELSKPVIRQMETMAGLTKLLRAGY